MTAAHADRGGPRTWLVEAGRIDRALYSAVATTPTPSLDRVMPRLSRAADHSKLSLAAAGVLAAFGGSAGRRAAASGLAAVAATSAVVNLVVKPLADRRRPSQTAENVLPARQVPMPKSGSFPSGHAATAVAFASATGRVLPAAGLPLDCLAALVGYSRVHTGVHYPGDVVAGAVIGAMLSDVSCAVGATWLR